MEGFKGNKKGSIQTKKELTKNNKLPGGESNPALARDRRVYSADILPGTDEEGNVSEHIHSFVLANLIVIPGGCLKCYK